MCRFCRQRWKRKPQELQASQQRENHAERRARRRCEALPGARGPGGDRSHEEMMERDSYVKLVEWSDEDQCYVGTCPGLMLGGVHGSNEFDVYKRLCEAIDGWIDIARREGAPLPKPTAGKSYSGKFVLRVGPELHRLLAIDALRAGASLNSYCVRLLEEGRNVLRSESSRSSRIGSRRTRKVRPE